jgi:serine/threonine protein kinase
MKQFEILENCGQGATGTVYRAKQIPMDRIVAVKFLREEFAGEPKVVRRFHREAKASARLTHANIITVHLVGETEQGVPYLVMEYLEGRDLDSVCKEEGALPVDKIGVIGAQIAEALAEAHANDVVHRDLKPANIKLCPRRNCPDFVKVLDFGIAKILEGEPEKESRLTKTGTVFGTPYYLAPEQASGEEIDHRADIYSLGVILYQMSTGKLPFGSKSGLEVLVQHIKEKPARPITHRPDLPVALEKLILKALEKDRASRFQSAEEIAVSLHRLHADNVCRVDSTQDTSRAARSAGPERRPPARSGGTLDMTGWQDHADSKKTGVGSKASGGLQSEKGTMFGMGSKDRQPVAELVRKAAANGAAAAATPTPPQKQRANHTTAAAASSGAKKATDASAPAQPGAPATSQTEDPATDSVTGKATFFSAAPAADIQPAPSPYVRPKEPPKPAGPYSAPHPQAPPASPSLVDTVPREQADRERQQEAAADDYRPAGAEDRQVAAGAGPAGAVGASDSPLGGGAAASPPVSSEALPVVERSGWGAEKVDSVASEFAAPGVGRSKTIAVIGGVVLLALGALATGTYFILKDRGNEQSGDAAAAQPMAAAAEDDEGDGGGKDSVAEDNVGANGSGTAVRAGERPRPLERGRTLEPGVREAKVTVGAHEVGFVLKGLLKCNKRARIVISFQKAQSGSDCKSDAVAQAPTLQLVDPKGGVRKVALQRRDGCLRGRLTWSDAGLHRLVLRYTRAGKGDRGPVMVWIAVPIDSRDSHHRRGRRRRGGRRRRRPMGGSHEPSPFVDPPTPPPDRPRPRPHRRQPHRPRPPRPRPPDPMSGGEDLPPPPPDGF